MFQSKTMIWCGLTGGIASGKSEVAKILRGRGFFVLDADQLAHQMTQPGTFGLQKIEQAFGPDYFLKKPDVMILDRKKLAELVFSNSEALLKLEGILHPLIQQEVKNQKAKWMNQKVSAAFYDVPLLFEKKMESQFDQIIVVTSPDEVRKKRLFENRKWTAAQIQARMANQIPLHQKIKLADQVIENAGSLEDLEAEVEKVLTKLNLNS